MIFQNAEYKLQYEKHRSLCPYCDKERLNDLAQWEKIVKKLQEAYAKDPGSASKARRPQKPKAGQFRWVKPALARWQDGFFYSPPLVLVLDAAGEITDDILVAQTWHDLLLAGPGDLILFGKDTGLADMDLFVETWNIYTLKASFLGPAVGKAVGKKIIDAALEMNRCPDYLSHWAMMPRPMADPHDPRIYFRELEIMVGSVFSIPAADALLADLYAGASNGISVDGARAAIMKFAPDAYWSNPPQTLEETLALARFYRLCAADSDESEIAVKLAVFHNAVLKKFVPLKTRIFQKQIIKANLVISGRILDPPAALANGRFIGFLDLPDGPPQRAAREEFDEATGSFYVEFEDVSEIHGHPEFAVFVVLPSRRDTKGS
jgi:hypothetical protein